ncbi:hypothetical protein [Streptomyces sp. NPDC058989]|uniref:hypothetical protein n=1 Tax=Streptomyces sp. NPDC058989 TaxID=3346686 RepID=UPI00369E4195
MIENFGSGSLRSLPLDELIAAWGGVGPHSERAEADPLVVDCARRLAADPGGERAPLWTFGLVTMASYVAWRPGEGVASRVVEALLAADSALGGRGCAHEAHPFRAALERIDDDGADVLVPELRDFPAHGREETADAGHDDASWCPTNVAACARITADVLTPFSTADTADTAGTRGVTTIPSVIPRRDSDALRWLSSTLCDHPYGDPALDLSRLALSLPDHPSKGVQAGYVAAMHASQWYAVSGRITDPEALDDMIEGLEKVLAQLAGSTCAHTPAEHPEPHSDPAGAARFGFYLRSPGGRAKLAEDARRRGDLQGWLCPAFLHSLADEALDELREGHAELFAPRETDHLDEEFLGADGRLALDRLARLLDDEDPSLDVDDLAVWAARRYLGDATADPRERAVLLLVMLWYAEDPYEIPYNAGTELRDALRAVDTSPLDAECPHGGTHPDTGDRLPSLLDHLHAPGECPAPDDGLTPDVWLCPHHLAERTQEALEELAGVLDEDE